MIAASAKSFYDACKDNFAETHNITDPNAKIHLSDAFSSVNLHAFFSGDSALYLAVGCVVSFLVAMVAVKFFIDFLNRHGFKYFGIYRVIVGCFIMFLLLRR